MNISKVAVPRYRKNPLVTSFSMLCPGISKNSKAYQLNLFKGQVWEEKSYAELCGNNILNVVYNQRAMLTEDIMNKNFQVSSFKNGKLNVPPTPGIGFIRDDFTQIPWNSEILQSFSELTHSTDITVSYYAYDGNSWQFIQSSFTAEIHVGSFTCKFWDEMGPICGCDSQGCFPCSRPDKHQCVNPHSHKSMYIWTKERFKIGNTN